MGTADRWTSQNGQQEGRNLNLNVNDKYKIRREKYKTNCHKEGEKMPKTK